MSLFRAEVIEGRRTRLHGDVMLTQPPSLKVLTCLLLLLVAAVVIWVLTGSYTRTEPAPGRIVPNGTIARIMPMRAGTITKLYVGEGARVGAGQALALIVIEQASADRADPIGEGLKSIDGQQKIISEQIVLTRNAATGEAARLRTGFAQLQSQIDSVSAQIVLQQRLIQSAQESFDALTSVMAKGYYPRIQYENRRQALLSQESQLRQLEGQRTELQGQLAQSRIDLSHLPDRTATQVGELRTSSESLTQKRIEAETSRAYVIRAPIAGRVSALQESQGAAVTSQMPLMSIIGEGSVMEAELYAPSRAIGFAREGQEVRLMYDAFPYQRFGSFGGRITRISRTILAPNEINAPIPTQEPVYRLRVALDKQTVQAFGSEVRLQPGMTLAGNIVLDRRSFLDWLLEPINAVRNRT